MNRWQFKHFTLSLESVHPPQIFRKIQKSVKSAKLSLFCIFCSVQTEYVMIIPHSQVYLHKWDMAFLNTVYIYSWDFWSSHFTVLSNKITDYRRLKQYHEETNYRFLWNKDSHQKNSYSNPYWISTPRYNAQSLHNYNQFALTWLTIAHWGQVHWYLKWVH